MRKTLLTFLDDFARRGEDIAFSRKAGYRTVRWSRRDVAAGAFRFARELASRHIEKGDRVMFWAENSPEWVIAFLGCLLRGVIVVPLDVQSASGFAERVRRQTEPKLLLYSGESAEGMAAGMPSLRLETLAQEISRHSGEKISPTGIEEDDIAEIIYTSGTTADPRGVCLTHRNLLANLNPLERGMQKYLRWKWTVHPLRFLSLVPLSHVFGQFMGLFVPQLLDGEVFFQDSLSPSEVIATTRRERISVTIAVPRLLDTLREKIERVWDERGGGKDLPRRFAGLKGKHFLKKWWAFRSIHRQFGWKFWAFVTGGAPLDADTEEFWHGLGYLLVQGYGMTETAALISFNNPFETTRGSLGKGFASQDLRLDEGGEILVRGGNVSPGYWKQGVQSLTDEEGWLRTGDLGARDAEGKLYFKGRKKDVIVTTAGLKVYPEDLEAELNRQPEVRESVVIGVGTQHGAEPLAVLLLRDEEADPGAIVQRANEQLSGYQQIRRWLVWPQADFPRTTTTRKVRRRDILETVQSRTGDAPRPPAPADILAETIARVSGESPARLDAAANLTTDLKLDSLGRVELLGALEDRLQIELEEAAFSQATTLGDVKRIIEQSQRQQGQPKQADRVERGRPYPFAEWAFRFPYTWVRRLVLYTLLLPAARLFGRARVCGKENLRDIDGPVLFVANHIAQLDAGLILSAVPARFKTSFAVAMEGERLRDFRYPPAEWNWLRRLVARMKYGLVVLFFNVFPLPQKGNFRKSFDFAGDLVDRGYSLLVFPEGRRTEDGRMGRFKRGTGLLVEGLKVKVIPVKIDGLFELKRRRRYFARPGQITVTFGEAVSYGQGEDADFITRDLEKRVTEV